MGLTRSKYKDPTIQGNSNNYGSRGATSNQVDEYEVLQLKWTIINDPNTFILNNLMMCIQFFENYDE